MLIFRSISEFQGLYVCSNISIGILGWRLRIMVALEVFRTSGTSVTPSNGWVTSDRYSLA